MIRLVLFQPDIPQNAGAVMRLGACFDVPVEIIEPCGFIWDDKRLKRSAMDYAADVNLTRYTSWEDFAIASQSDQGRLVLFTTKAEHTLDEVQFKAGDRLVFGRESAGVPDMVHQAATLRIRIPMAPSARSLNLAQAAAIGCAEALRQIGGFPGQGDRQKMTTV